MSRSSCVTLSPRWRFDACPLGVLRSRPARLLPANVALGSPIGERLTRSFKQACAYRRRVGGGDWLEPDGAARLDGTPRQDAHCAGDHTAPSCRAAASFNPSIELRATG